MGCPRTETSWAALLWVCDRAGTLQGWALDPVAPDVGVLGRDREKEGLVQVHVHRFTRRKMLGDGHIITTDHAGVGHPAKDISSSSSNPQSHLSSPRTTRGTTAALSHLHPQHTKKVPHKVPYKVNKVPHKVNPTPPRERGSLNRKKINLTSLRFLWSN